MGGEKAVAEVLKWLTKSSYHKLSASEDRFSSPLCKMQNSSNENTRNQVFSDHTLTTQRFQKTFYYGELSQTNFHPPLALTDVTLELFNKTVPNEGRLDILNMDYASHVSKSICISPYSMILAMMYVEQLRHKNPDYLENVSPCDLYVVSMLVASKYLFDDDELTYNYDWANVINLEIEDLNRLEKEFLLAINWELFTKASDYFEFLTLVEQRIAFKQSSARGWLSYTDTFVMSKKKSFMQFWLHFSGVIIKVVVIITVGYIGCILALFGVSLLLKAVIVEGMLKDHHMPENTPLVIDRVNISDSLNVLRTECLQNTLHHEMGYENLITSVKKEETSFCIGKLSFSDKNLNFEGHGMHNKINKCLSKQQSMPNILLNSFVNSGKQIQSYSHNKYKCVYFFVNCNDSIILWPLYLQLSNQNMNTFIA